MSDGKGAADQEHSHFACLMGHRRPSPNKCFRGMSLLLGAGERRALQGIVMVHTRLEQRGGRLSVLIAGPVMSTVVVYVGVRETIGDGILADRTGQALGPWARSCACGVQGVCSTSSLPILPKHYS